MSAEHGKAGDQSIFGHENRGEDDEISVGHGKKSIGGRIEIIVDEARAVATEAAEEARTVASDAIRRSGVESIAESIRDTLQGALSGRDKVVMVRLNQESLGRLDELVDAGLVNSRSEAAAFLVDEGIRARNLLFDRISEKIDQIRKAREELKDLLDEPVNPGLPTQGN